MSNVDVSFGEGSVTEVVPQTIPDNEGEEGGEVLSESGKRRGRVGMMLLAGAVVLPTVMGVVEKAEAWSLFGEEKKTTGCISGDCEDGRGVFVKPGGKRYEGEFRDGNKHGKGVYTWANGNTYEGDFRNDYIEGYGGFVWGNGDRYEGEYMNGKRHGKGTTIYARGTKKTGDWMNDKLYYGKIHWTTGRIDTVERGQILYPENKLSSHSVSTGYSSGGGYSVRNVRKVDDNYCGYCVPGGDYVCASNTGYDPGQWRAYGRNNGGSDLMSDPTVALIDVCQK